MFKPVFQCEQQLTYGSQARALQSHGSCDLALDVTIPFPSCLLRSIGYLFADMSGITGSRHAGTNT